jgi:hypothetical protein
LFEFVVECLGLTDLPGRNFERRLLVQPRFHLPPDFFAQMIFQFLQRHGGFDANRQHLPPPVGNVFFEVHLA